MSTDYASMLLVVLLLALLPFAAMVVTSYTKIVVVLGLLRNAIGVQTVPPNTVLNGIALIISCFIMAPVAMDAMQTVQAGGGASTTGQQSQIITMIDAARAPFRKFLLAHTHEREKAFFINAAQRIWPPERAAELKKDDLIILAPSFILTELTDAFRIGFLIYLAFVIVDLVIANALMALGLSQVTPTNIAIPFKLLLFVGLDGWSTLLHGLVLSYR